MNARYKLSFLFVLYSAFVFCQITVVNPSFEDKPSDATIPKGWLACQPSTTPDILPGFWGEYGEAQHGNTYLGIITRENGTYESIGQRMSASLKEGGCYRFSIDLAHGKVYSGYNLAIKLRIYIGKNKCDKDQLVYESETITNEEWKKHFIEFNADSDYDYIILEAFYQEGQFRHKGNVLIDNLSNIKFCGKV